MTDYDNTNRGALFRNDGPGMMHSDLLVSCWTR
jgi:hypothetical protein